ncbi:stage III sporulation protein AB [Vulcanibacillus modesticaldus]|uniref:Stage III sporulation protein AB n=1 Tax=Vulcanibacillus modesticaldus TaxID=337097 RepID=A0A1D2YRQ2_9BACI|nr:stage III sporulation protein SpoIIIAB [Vulcanibacillus modesticaldus]OEF95508.1 stage III sporulation protein AB [Vulcanibacillus modesticaldus]
MLKLLGATLIIAASSFGGFYIARLYRERPIQLRMLGQALRILETEIIYGSNPLYQAMEHIGQRVTGALGLIFLTMSENLLKFDGASTFECWEDAINQHFHQTSLKKQDREILINFGQTLGISDKEDQMKHIRMTIQNLAAEESLAREEQKTYEKLSKNLGVLLGMLIVILIY